MKADKSGNKPCPHPKRLDLPYLAWHEEAERRTKAGMKQKQCPACKLWLWKDEF
jgi:hypothetical protein